MQVQDAESISYEIIIHYHSLSSSAVKVVMFSAVSVCGCVGLFVNKITLELFEIYVNKITLELFEIPP